MGSLLSASRTHGDIKTAVRAMVQLVELEPEESGNYMLLSNMYAEAGNCRGRRDVARLS